MLLIHQAGSVKVGEVVRYTLTYTPGLDRILPTPSHLHLKIKNTCAIPLRAAWVHGPYALHVSAYPATFNPHCKQDEPDKGGVPQFEPMLKAAGSWKAELLVPESIRETGADLSKRRSRQSHDLESAGNDGSVTWIIEIASQILFSSSASVSFEVLVGRDERSLELGFAAVAGSGHSGPGQIKEKQAKDEKSHRRKSSNVQRAGVYSKAVTLIAENTDALWDKPPLPTWNEDAQRELNGEDHAQPSAHRTKRRKRKNVHLVIVTHGLHSNVGADMLFMKESIDAAAAQARISRKKRRKEARRGGQPTAKREVTSSTSEQREDDSEPTATAPLTGGQEEIDDGIEDSDDEETIVRGFSGNAVRTENGILYLGKRLAKYILRFTYPDQPFLPVKKSFSKTLTGSLRSEAGKVKRDGVPSHPGSSITPQMIEDPEDLPYKFTSISFVGHSLGGLIQTYAIAYIHKHNPSFFEQIKPINFVCMASPMLGLSNENPIYIKFALDFGVVGRTGQDLGLTWRPPTLAKGGWNAVMNNFGSGQKAQDQKYADPGAKPLLRILPTGPAHQVLKMFRNRTVYSNVVNDGIVPLRTSCLLFLDWRGLSKVEKARRENGLIGTVAEWGWAELTGANLNTAKDRVMITRSGSDDDEETAHVRQGEGNVVPRPEEGDVATDEHRTHLSGIRGATAARPNMGSRASSAASIAKTPQPEKGIFDTFLGFFKNENSHSERPKSPTLISRKTSKALSRGQTVYHDEESTEDERSTGQDGTMANPSMRPRVSRLPSTQGRPNISKSASYYDEDTGELHAPPKTSIFESAGDILHPPLPSLRWIVDPESRTQTIFHDRVYRPEDIPPPPRRKKSSTKLLKSFLSDTSTVSDGQQAGAALKIPVSGSSSSDSSGMKVEEKIARAYHHDLTWRKVLVRLEPDAHNNIIVRRMFANAYGWPVIKHLCDTHFADTHTARTSDDQEALDEHLEVEESQVIRNDDSSTEAQLRPEDMARSQGETTEAEDEVTELNESIERAASSYSSNKSTYSMQNSIIWDDSFLDGSDGDDSDMDERLFVQKMLNPHAVRKPEPTLQPRPKPSDDTATNATPPKSPLIFMEGHRGLSPTTARSPMSFKSAASQQSTFDSASVERPVVANKFVQEPERMDSQRGLSTAAIGLRKSIEDQLSPSKPKL